MSQLETIKNESPVHSNITILEIAAKSEVKEFINLPWSLYSHDPKWVPPLKMAVAELLNKKHPFHATADSAMFLARKNGKTVGRIMAVNNKRFNEFHQKKDGHFGFFDCINDQEVADQLLNTAAGWLRTRGLETMEGPCNPSTNYECGTLIEGFDDPAQIMMTYNPPYTKTLLETWGLTKTMDLLAYKIDMSFEMPEKIVRISEHAKQKGNITFRTIDMKNFNQEIKLMQEIYNSAWEKNWGFVPMTDQEFAQMAKELKMVVDPNLIIFVYVKGEVAGFLVGLPDYNQIFHTIKNGELFPLGLWKILTGKKKINRFRVLTMGVKSKFRNLGLASILYMEAYNNARVRYNVCEMSWILETNADMNRPLILMGAVPYKRYRVFNKLIANAPVLH